jgi:hypothetical protein
MECVVFQLDLLKYIAGHKQGSPYNVNHAQFVERLYAVKHKFWSNNGTKRNFKIGTGNVLFHITSSFERKFERVALILIKNTLWVRN